MVAACAAAAAGGAVAARGAKKHGAENANIPKKPSGGGYGVFLAQNRYKIEKTLPPGTKITDVAKAKWKALPADKQKPYTEKFRANMAAYKEKLKAYNAVNSGAADDPAAKRRRGAKAAENEDETVMDEAKELKYLRQLKTLRENPKVAEQGTSLRQVLNALKEANGSTITARKALIGGA